MHIWVILMVEFSIGLFGSIFTLVFGILVIMFPKILNYLVGIYLIVLGIAGILGAAL